MTGERVASAGRTGTSVRTRWHTQSLEFEGLRGGDGKGGAEKRSGETYSRSENQRVGQGGRVADGEDEEEVEEGREWGRKGYSKTSRRRCFQGMNHAIN